MATKYLVFSLMYLKIAYSQYYSLPTPPTPSAYPAYSQYTYNYYNPTAIPAPPTVGPTYANVPPAPQIPSVLPRPPISPKQSVSTSPPTLQSPKCSPPTATAYYLTTPSEIVKATVLPKEKIKRTGKESVVLPPTYSCPLCNNFADVPLNPKIPPPPPVGSPVLPGTINEVSTKGILKDLTLKSDPISILSKKVPALAPLFSDMYEKHKLSKNLSFDQELLEGFLTGLGLAL